MKIVKISTVWCPSCLVMNPRYKEVKDKYPDIDFISLDLDLDEESKEYNVGSILPVFILFDSEGKEIERLIGEYKTKDLINTLEKHL